MYKNVQVSSELKKNKKKQVSVNLKVYYVWFGTVSRHCFKIWTVFPSFGFSFESDLLKNEKQDKNTDFCSFCQKPFFYNIL